MPSWSRSSRPPTEGVGCGSAWPGTRRRCCAGPTAGSRRAGHRGRRSGCWPIPSWTRSTVLLRPGDLLCLFTDGITEARRGIDVYGEERLARTLATARRRPKPWPTRLLADVAAFRQEGEGDEPGRDDATLLLLGLV